ncbi:trichohyalin [Drosophila subobscura]|uniref:trichohyalin n=1 Tax=Drosophila subobscura TaxID=7241 RepID=UPI00155A7BE3|nr:trichohyalin [Drosophila subobscura]
MRLFVLGLLALGSVQAFAVVRTIQPQPHPQLLAYAPARGEFPVVSGLAQGYVRYLDGTGAERLLAYNYPEPLNGIRASAGLLRSGLASEEQPQDTALFRAWCEQRYNAMRLELERLRAQGLQPSPQMMAQFEPLEQIVKYAAFDAVPGLSPEVQRARDEHLRIWNEARLEVLRAEQAQQLTGHYQPQEQIVQVKTTQKATPVIYGQQFQIKSAEAPQTHSYGQNPFLVKSATITGYTQETPQPVEETPEVKLAREQHLKQFFAALHRQPEAVPELPILKTIPGIQQPQANIKTISYVEQQQQQQSPQPVEETPEVKLAREQHLKQFHEALQRQPIAETNVQAAPQVKYETAQSDASFKFPTGNLQTPQAVEETEEVKQAREQHLKQFNEALQRQPIDVQQQPLIPSAQFAPQIKTIEQPMAQQIEDTPEVKLAREQHLQLLNKAKVRAEDKLEDIKDMIRLEELERDEEKLRERERQVMEQKEAALERLREEERLSQESRLLQAEQLKIEEEDRQRLYAERQAEQQELKSTKNYDTGSETTTTSDSDSLPLFLGATEGGSIKLLSSQAAPAPAQTQASTISQQQSVQNGFFLRIQTSQPNAIQTSTAPIGAPAFVYTDKAAPAAFIQPYTVKETYSQASPAGATELELATREHLRAHEIALEQLRLANLQKPWNPDCNH